MVDGEGMSESDVLCFHCGLPVGDPPRLNEMADGEVCPVCRDRLLEELPPIVHSPTVTLGTARAPEPRGDSAEAPTEPAEPAAMRVPLAGESTQVGTSPTVSRSDTAEPGQQPSEGAPWPRLLVDDVDAADGDLESESRGSADSDSGH